MKKTTPGIDAVDGMTSRVTPHCFRRAWATIALNDEKSPTPIDVVSEVLRHQDIEAVKLDGFLRIARRCAASSQPRNVRPARR
jgi:integrase